MKRLLAAAGLALALAACNDQFASNGKSLAPIPPRTMSLMADKGMAKSDPILVRLYKKESELEVWKKGSDGKYAMLKTFPICRWSGQLGPKRKEGDRQAPEGFYTVNPGQMNPNSAYYLSFNTGYPNAFDRAQGGTGSDLMVHGNCSSRGCYAMTDEGIAEVYALAREAFSGGQRAFQFQAYPFRMTAENLAKHRYDPNMPFWKNLKEGADTFEITRAEPKVAVCGGRYAFNTVGTGCTTDPALTPLLAEKEDKDRREVAELVAKGVPAVRTVYADGGGHDTFRQAAGLASGDAGSNFALLDARPSRNLGEVSRPDALAQGPREIAIDANGRPAGDAREPAATIPRKGAPTRLAAKPAAPSSRMVVASADATAATATPAPATPTQSPASESRTLYDRMLGLIEPKAEAQPAAPVAEVVAADASASTGKLPPRRPTASATPTAPKVAPAPKPQASLESPSVKKVAALATAKRD